MSINYIANIDIYNLCVCACVYMGKGFGLILIVWEKKDNIENWIDMFHYKEHFLGNEILFCKNEVYKWKEGDWKTWIIKWKWN